MEGTFLPQIYKIMNKSDLDFLQECKKELASMKDLMGAMETRLNLIQSKLEETPAEVPAEADEVDFTGVELGVADPIETAPVPEPETEPEPETDVVSAEASALSSATAETTPSEVPAAPAAPATSAADTANYSWRKDNPGIQVKNIRSGISLLDRAQFIGTLFKEDFALYDSTIAALNNMETLDQAVAYIQENFPQWNLGSDVVYRFMMAVRKKLG